jgi:hypothetical protein
MLVLLKLRLDWEVEHEVCTIKAQGASYKRKEPLMMSMWEPCGATHHAHVAISCSFLFMAPKTTNWAIKNLGYLLKKLSLSLTHTHIHTHKHTLRIFLSYDNSSNFYGLSFNAKMKCWVTSHIHTSKASKQACGLIMRLGSTSKWTWKFHDGIAGPKMAVCCSYNNYYY